MKIRKNYSKSTINNHSVILVSSLLNRTYNVTQQTYNVTVEVTPSYQGQTIHKGLYKSV